MHDISIRAEDFDAGDEIASLGAGDDRAGAIATFVGLVRGGDVTAMTLEHYTGMTEMSLAAILDEAHSRWEIRRSRVIHRIGRLLPGDRIVFVGVSAGHRGDAFAACEFIMDYLKTRAPFWKKEETAGGTRWVDARETDATASQRWSVGQRNAIFEKEH